MHEYVKISVISNYCVCVCVCVCVRPLERESFLMVYTEYQFLIF